jgi:hypothetical protein
MNFRRCVIILAKGLSLPVVTFLLVVQNDVEEGLIGERAFAFDPALELIF